MRYWYIVLIYMIAMLLRLEIFTYEADPQQMIVKIVSYGSFCSVDLLGLDHLMIELMRNG